MADITETTYPDPSEIKPYVAVGPTQDLSITVHKSTFDTGFIVVTIVFGMALIIVVAVTIFFAYQASTLPPPPSPLPLNLPPDDMTLHTNIGAQGIQSDLNLANITAKECESISNTVWVNNRCECQSSFFGPTCTREKHDKKYYSVGIPNEETLGMSVLTEVMSNGKSFNVVDGVMSNNGSCSDLCNKNSDCIGFIYHSPGMCTLLTGEIVVPSGSGIAYSNEIDSTLYMKSSDNLQFADRIFLGEYIGSFPPRYWLVKETNHYKQLMPYEIGKLSFAPVYTKIHGTYTGIYCLHPFTSSEIDILLSRGDTSECYIHRPGTTINLPIDWKYRTPLYVTYV